MPFRLDTERYRRKKIRLIPSSVEELLRSEMMVLGLVKEIYELTDDDVARVNVKHKVPGKGHIQGNLSDSGRMSVEVILSNGVSSTHHWFVKVMQDYNNENEINRASKIFKNEITFYEDIVPEMKKYITEDGFPEHLARLDFPELIFAKQDSRGAIIILEDVIEAGFNQERDESGCRFLSLDKALLTVSSIARLHVISMMYERRLATRLDDRHPSLREAGLMWTEDLLTSKLDTVKENYCDVLSKSPFPESPGLLERFKTSDLNCRDKLKRWCVERCDPDSKSVACLQHGDLHFNNLLFKREGDNWRIVIVDWQLAYTGRSTGDLTYLLLSSVRQSTRNVHGEHIKRHYFNTFNNTFQRMEQALANKMNNNNGSNASGININYIFDHETSEKEFDKSLPMSILMSCGNVLIKEDNKSLEENEDVAMEFAHHLCEEAAKKNII